MSAIVNVKAYDLKRVFESINPLFPSGSKEIPIGISLRNGKLTIVCLQGVVYQATIPVDEPDVTGDATILYYNILPLIPTDGKIQLQLTPNNLQLVSEDFEAQFPFGYSVVAVQDFPNLVYANIPGVAYLDGLRHLTRLNLDKLYSINSPIVVVNNMSLQKFPNTWIQVRTNGLPFSATLDTDHVKLIEKFEPHEVSISIPNSLVFKNENSILQVPCRPNVDSTLITSLMEDMGDPITISLEKYLDKIRNMSKINSKAHCKIAIYSTGVKTSIQHEGTTVSVATENLSGDVLKVFHFPIQLWITFLRGLGGTTAQILCGGDKICLRTATMIIVSRVLG